MPGTATPHDLSERAPCERFPAVRTRSSLEPQPTLPDSSSWRRPHNLFRSHAHELACGRL